MTNITDSRRNPADDAAMAHSVFCTDCPECRSEILVDLGTAHRPFGDNEKMLFRVVCTTCGLAYDVHFEDLVLTERSEDDAIHFGQPPRFGQA